MNRLRQRQGWIFSLLIVGGGVVAWGQLSLFAHAVCPPLQRLVLYGAALVWWIVFALYALLTRDDSLLRKISSWLLMGGLILATSTLMGGALVKNPSVRLVYCPGEICQQADLAKTLREQHRFQAAVDVARACLETAAPSSECLTRCAEELVLGVYEKIGEETEHVLEKGEGRWETCQSMSDNLQEAYLVAQQHGLEKLKLAVQERQARVNLLCPTPTVTPMPTSTPTPTPTPTPVVEVEVLRAQRVGNQAYVDLRVFKNGKEVTSLTASDFVVRSGDASVAFEVENRHADDPVCVVAVIDNSGSIYPGRKAIQVAVQKLNDLRKPGDELGMVLFSSHDEIRVFPPSPNSLEPSVVTGEGDLTALWDATLEGLDLLSECQPQHRYLIVLTDGMDNDSVHLEGDPSDKARAVAELAAQQHVSICGVGVQSSVALDENSLRLASYGCGYYPAADFDQVAAVFQQIFGFVRDFYRLSWDASLMSDATVNIEVMGREVTVNVQEISLTSGRK